MINGRAACDLSQGLLKASLICKNKFLQIAARGVSNEKHKQRNCNLRHTYRPRAQQKQNKV